MQAMLDSLRNAGHTVEKDSLDADAAIIWSALWYGRMAPNKAVYENYRAHGKPVIIVDVGALYRGETWKVALNTITSDGFYGHQQDLDLDRPRKLGISLAINLSRNPQIVIAVQHKRSLQVAKLDSMESWISQQVQAIQAVTDRPIVVRPHPRSALDPTLLPPGVQIEQPQRVQNTYDSYNLTFDCHAIINYNSSPGIQAALAGTRPVVDQSSLAYPVAINWQDLEQPYQIDRDQWLIEICHTEYTLSELRKGTWLHRLCLT
jgi:hypothetical protein